MQAPIRAVGWGSGGTALIPSGKAPRGSTDNLFDKLSIREGYDTYVSKFFDLLSLFFLGPSTTKSHSIILESLKGEQPSAILDVGCGTGNLLKILAREPAGARLVGLDLSRSMLGSARTKLAESALDGRVDLVLGDAESLPFRDSSFSGVTCSGVLRFLPEPIAAFREAYRALEPGGRLALREMAGPQQDVRRVKHLPLPSRRTFVVWRLWSKSAIERMLGQAGFVSVVIFGREVIPHFVFAMAPPLRQYVFTSARKPA